MLCLGIPVVSAVPLSTTARKGSSNPKEQTFFVFIILEVTKPTQLAAVSAACPEGLT